MRLNPDQIYTPPNGMPWRNPHPEAIQRQLQRCLQEAEIPPRYAATSFETLDPHLHPEAFQACREFATTGAYQGQQGLLLIGPPGTGKTALAIATLRQVAIRHQGLGGVHFWNVPCGLEEIRRSINRPESLPVSILDLQCNRLLVLDDLGQQKMSEWVLEQFFTLIDHLWTQNKQFVVTTNLSQERFVGGLNGALVSRLLGMCHELVLEGPDQRLRQRG